MQLHKPPTLKQARFIAEYLKYLNGSEAAIRAGYGGRSARHTASRLLQKPHIKAELVGRAMLRVVQGRADRFILESADINRGGA